MKTIEGVYLGSREIEDGKIVGRIEPEEGLAELEVPIGLLPDRVEPQDKVTIMGTVQPEGVMLPPKERLYVVDRIEAGIAVMDSWRGSGNLSIPAKRIPNPHEGAHYELIFLERPKIEEQHEEDLEELQEELSEDGSSRG